MKNVDFGPASKLLFHSGRVQLQRSSFNKKPHNRHSEKGKASSLVLKVPIEADPHGT